MSPVYVIAVKNNNSYDIIDFWKHNDSDILNAIDIALDSGFPITSMNASEHKLTAVYGSTYDGISFFGGKKILITEEPTKEQLDSFDLYVFLCNNTVIARVAALNHSYKKEMFSAAHDSGMTLLKVPEGQILEIGKTYTLDGNFFKIVE